MGIPIDPTWLEAVLLATVRMTAFLIVAPPFSHQAFPGRVKAMLGLGLGLAVTQRMVGGYTPRDTAGFVTGSYARSKVTAHSVQPSSMLCWTLSGSQNTVSGKYW